MRTTIALLTLLISTGTVFGEEKPLKVLFLGNSYTYGNDLPGMIAAMADAAGGRKIETDRITPGGCTFQRHVEGKKALAKIREKPWDAVVLQEQSMMPCVDPKRMHKYARLLHAEIDKRGARTVFFLTWARQHKPEMQNGLNKAYFTIAKELGAEVAPVGMAWKNAFAADPKLVLHRNDKSHPNPAGTYLAACVFYATLLDKNPVGLPAEIKRGNKTLVKLDPKLARKLQEIAWKTVQDVNRSKAVSQ